MRKSIALSEPAEIDNQFARSWSRAKRTAVEYLAVFIATIGFVFGVLGLTIGGLALWVAYDANENAKVATMYLTEVQAQLRAKEGEQ